MINIRYSLYRSIIKKLGFGSILTLLIILISGQCQAQYLNNKKQSPETADRTARNAMQQGNYAVAYCIWQPLAEGGDSGAQYNLGWMYHNGYGLSINDEKALYWWLKSATTGNANSHYALGDLYAQGQGVEKNIPISLGWYISAALKGHEPAREMLMALLNSKDKQIKNTFHQLLKTEWSILGDTMQVNVDKANTRRGPAKSYKVVTTLKRGHIVIPLQEQNGWTYIGITGKGKTAWIFNPLISKPAGLHSVE